jgi:GntR family histidine utilization transcriptional repressor
MVARMTDTAPAGTSANTLPRHTQVKNHLLQQIRSGALKPSDRTESENELARRFGVSRLTVQRAIRELVAEGRLTRVQGSGTFVASKPQGFSLFEVRGIADQVREQGGDPMTEVLIQRQCVPDAKVRDLLELPEGEPIFEAVLLRKNRDQPVALETRSVRREPYPDFLEHNFEQESMYEFLARHSVLGELETTLSAVLPPPLTCQRLNIRVGDPCLLLERRNRVNGTVLTFSSFTFAGSRMSLSSRYRAT